jgi:alanine racemase
VRGRPAPILEPISLEHCRVDLTAVPDAAVGDEVIVIGTQGGETIGIDDVAAHRGLQANEHRVAISIRGSVPRRYIDDPA